MLFMPNSDVIDCFKGDALLIHFTDKLYWLRNPDRVWFFSLLLLSPSFSLPLQSESELRIRAGKYDLWVLFKMILSKAFWWGCDRGCPSCVSLCAAIMCNGWASLCLSSSYPARLGQLLLYACRILNISAALFFLLACRKVVVLCCNCRTYLSLCVCECVYLSPLQKTRRDLLKYIYKTCQNYFRYSQLLLFV